MWFDVWLLARGIGLGDIFKDISTSVRLFSQFICLTLCLYIPLFLKEIQKFVETLQRSLEGIVLVVQMHKIYFTSVTLPERCFEVFFANFCVLQLFLCASFILRTIQFLYISFFTDDLGVTQRVTSLKKLFASISPSSWYRQFFVFIWQSKW